MTDPTSYDENSDSRDSGCRSCGNNFVRNHPQQVYCSPQCRQREKFRRAQERPVFDSPEKREAKLARRRELNKKRRSADPARYRAYETKYDRAHPDRHRRYYAANKERYQNYAKNRYAMKQDEINRRRRERYAANPEKRGKANRRYYARNAAQINERVRARRAVNPEKHREADRKRYAANRELRRQRARDSYSRHREAIRNREQERRQAERALLQAAKRPPDWEKRPLEWRIIANELLSRDYISNDQLGAILDGSRLIRCPFGDSWSVALRFPGRAANYISDIRKWVNRPGKRPGQKPLSTT